MSRKTKSVLLVVLVHVCATLPIIIISLKELHNINKSAHQTNAQVRVKYIAEVVSNYMILADEEALDRFMWSEMYENNFKFIEIRNAAGLLLLEAKVNSKDNRAEKAGESQNKPDYFNVKKGIYSNKEKIGMVIVGVKARPRTYLTSNLASEIFIFSGISILSFIIIIYLIQASNERKIGRINSDNSNLTDRSQKQRVFDYLSKTSIGLLRIIPYQPCTPSEDKTRPLSRIISRNKPNHSDKLILDALNNIPQSILILKKNKEVIYANNYAKELYKICANKNIKGTLFEEPIFEENANTSVELTSIEEIKTKNCADILGADKCAVWQTQGPNQSTILHIQKRISGDALMVIDKDITHITNLKQNQSHLEGEFLQSRSMYSLGKLTTDIAHEINTSAHLLNTNLKFLSDAFNNINTWLDCVLSGTCTQIRNIDNKVEWEFLKEEIPSALEEATYGIETIGRIIQLIKEFSYLENSHPVDTDLVELVRSAVTISKSQWRHSAKVTIFSQEQQVKAPCYPVELLQVIVSIIVNGAEAIADYAQTSFYENGIGRIEVQIKKNKSSCTITINDNGPGINSTNLEEIFDPSYTTKYPGAYNGKSLAICKSIVESRHGGKLTVFSEYRKGARLAIDLPLKRTKNGNCAPVDHRAA